MSKPRTPFADVEASLDSAKRAWIQEMLAALGKVQSVTVAPAQAAPAEPPLVRGGVPVRQIEDVLEQQRREQIKGTDPNQKKQQDAVKKAYEKIEADKHIDKQWSFEDALKEENKSIPPVFQFPGRKPPILGPDERLAVGDNDYQKLPKDLKEKMSVEVWEKIKGQRATLMTIYLRLREYGAWDLVSTVTGIKEKLPGHGSVGAVEFKIYGTGGIAFEEKNMGALAALLVSTRHFGKDNKLMSVLHAGQDSYREWRAEEIIPSGVLDESIHEWGRKNPPPTSSMHVSTGPGKAFDAHIDRISPVNKPVDGQSVPNTDAGEHIATEAIGPDKIIPLVGKIPVIGKLLEKIPKPPGVRPGATMENTSVVPRAPTKTPTVWLKFSVEWDILGGNTKKRKRVYNPHPPQLPALPADVFDAIQKAKPISRRFPKTSESDIDAEVLADVMARKVLDAAKKGNPSISVDFPNYINTTLTDAEQKIVRDAVLEIGNIVSSALGSKAGSVKTVTVYLPANGALNVPIKK